VQLLLVRPNGAVAATATAPAVEPGEIRELHAGVPCHVAEFDGGARLYRVDDQHPSRHLRGNVLGSGHRVIGGSGGAGSAAGVGKPSGSGYPSAGKPVSRRRSSGADSGADSASTRTWPIGGCAGTGDGASASLGGNSSRFFVNSCALNART
jgi:hypothetical protein